MTLITVYSSPPLHSTILLMVCLVLTIHAIRAGGLVLVQGMRKPRVPDASFATTCGCFKPVTHDALAFQLKLQVERTISKSSAVFAEAGYMTLTGGQTNTIPGTDYGVLNSGKLSLGWRTCLCYGDILGRKQTVYHRVPSSSAAFKWAAPPQMLMMDQLTLYPGPPPPSGTVQVITP